MRVCVYLALSLSLYSIPQPRAQKSHMCVSVLSSSSCQLTNLGVCVAHRLSKKPRSINSEPNPNPRPLTPTFERIRGPWQLWALKTIRKDNLKAEERENLAEEVRALARATLYRTGRNQGGKSDWPPLRGVEVA